LHKIYTCLRCGDGGILDVQYDYEAAALLIQRHPFSGRSGDMWRYAELLPVSPDIAPPYLRIGWTPVYDVPRLASAIGIGKLLLKDEGGNPTSSFKDRASAIG
jgi:threonine synthase